MTTNNAETMTTASEAPAALAALRFRLRQFVEMLEGGSTEAEPYPGDDEMMRRLAHRVAADKMPTSDGPGSARGKGGGVMALREVFVVEGQDGHPNLFKSGLLAARIAVTLDEAYPEDAPHVVHRYTHETSGLEAPAANAEAAPPGRPPVTAEERAAELVHSRWGYPRIDHGEGWYEITSTRLQEDYSDEEVRRVVRAAQARIARAIRAAEIESSRRALERAAEMVSGEGHEGLAIALRALAAAEESS